MKKYLIIFLVFILCMGCTLPASAAPTVLVDGIQLSFDVPPAIEQGRTLVPLRAIFEALGAEVHWDGKTQTVTALAGETQIVLTIGKTTAHINKQPRVIDVPAKIVTGRTLVPLRFISEALGADVQWHDKTQTIVISTQKTQPLSVVPKPFMIRNSTWGASVQEVKNSEGGRPFEIFEDNSFCYLLYSDLGWKGYPCDVAYMFTGDRLLSAKYILDGNSLTTDKLLRSYYTVEQMLNDEYGPGSFEPEWYDKQYLDDIDMWGYALSIGDLGLYTSWTQGDTLIELYMLGVDGDVSWIIYCSDQEYLK